MQRMDPRFALLGGFGQWLNETTSGRYVTQGSRLDPYRTSFRRSGVAVPWLDRIEQGLLPQTGDPNQNISDLGAAGLVTGSVGSQPSLTPLGQLVLQGWRDLGVHNQGEANEVARTALLVRAGLSLGYQTYQAMYSFWCELVAVRPAMSWFSDVAGLYLASYLNTTSSGGYNPYRILRALGDTFVDEVEIWQEWASGAEGSDQLKKFVRTLTNWATRPIGRRTFCQGMEAVRLVIAGTSDLPSIIRTWSVLGERSAGQCCRNDCRGGRLEKTGVVRMDTRGLSSTFENYYGRRSYNEYSGCND